MNRELWSGHRYFSHFSHFIQTLPTKSGPGLSFHLCVWEMQTFIDTHIGRDLAWKNPFYLRTPALFDVINIYAGDWAHFFANTNCSYIRNVIIILIGLRSSFV